MRLYGGVRIVNQPCMDNVRRLDMGALPMISDMQRNGMRVDVGHLNRLSVQLTQEMEELNEKGNKLTGFPISFNSPDQIAELLFRKIGIKTKHKIRLTDSGKREQVDSDVLDMIQDLHPVIPMIKDYRQRAKLKDTYCDPLPRKINRETGRIHTRISTTRTATGRLASSDPNLQNIPTRGKLGPEIRKAFVPSPGNIIGTIDESQIELRVVASERKVKKMLEAYQNGVDIHTVTALNVFRLPPEAVKWPYFKHKYRLPSKTINFLVVYEGSAPALRIQLVSAGADAQYWTEDKCAEAIFNWYQTYPEVQDGLKIESQRARRYGMVWDAVGRVRLVPEVKSVHPWVVSAGLRQAGNMPIQSLAAATVKLAMAEIQADIVRYWRRFGVMALMQVHDELIFEGPPDVLPDFLYYCGAVFQGCYPLDVPIEYGVAMSEKSWGDLEK